MIELISIGKTFEGPVENISALSGVSLGVQPGELVAVMGRSGSGKSTLLNIAGGLDVPTTGRVLIDGTDLGEMSRGERARLRRERIGYIFQDYNLVPTLTVAENIALPLELDGKDAGREVSELLAEFELEEFSGRFPSEISRGQAQLVALARALITPGRIILADEPTGALDTRAGERVLEALRRRIDAGAAGILVTHESRYAAYADRAFILRDGVLVGEEQ